MTEENMNFSVISSKGALEDPTSDDITIKMYDIRDMPLEVVQTINIFTAFVLDNEESYRQIMRAIVHNGPEFTASVITVLSVLFGHYSYNKEEGDVDKLIEKIVEIAHSIYDNKSKDK